MIASVVASRSLAAGETPKKPEVSGQDATNYILGPDDQIAVRVLGAPEIGEKPVRIDLDGNIELTYIGKVKAAGLSLPQLKDELTTRLKSLIREPEVSVTIEEFRSQPVSILGAVNTPGVQQIRGRKSLVEVLAMSGGLRSDAGNSLEITRRTEFGSLNLPHAKVDSTGRFSTAKVNLKELMEARIPAENIAVQPNDVITIPRAQMVYVVGEVQKAGGFVLNEQEDISILKALSLAGGLNRTASPEHAKIIRTSPADKSKQEIAIDLRKVLNGHGEDFAMRPEDILFVPGSMFKRASLRGLEAAIQLGTGIAIWRQRP